ncbi:MAG: SDR family NAD(P)-dependent oxidoreductase, partial [Caulobacteraceae bacterium]
MSFAGQVALVTGGADGIGAAVVRRFARDGAKLAIADVKIDKARRLAEELAQGGARAKPI